MKKLKKILSLGLIIIVVGVTATISVGSIRFIEYPSYEKQQWESNFRGENDTTPPVTICILDPTMPDGDNGWYISNVEVTLNATDDISGVNVTFYRINEDVWIKYSEPFLLENEGYYLIEFYSIDNVGNKEEVKSTEVQVDKTKPEILLHWEAYQDGGKIYIEFTAECDDATSGMNRVEYYKDGVLKKIITGSKPEYYWDMPWAKYPITGVILNPEITEEYVNFFALIAIIGVIDLSNYPFDVRAVAYDNAGNSDYKEVNYYPPNPKPITGIFNIVILQRVTLPNSYKGYIGNFFVLATFEDGPK